MLLIQLMLVFFLGDYEFKSDYSVEYMRKINRAMYFGNLDQHGNFVPSQDSQPIDLSNGGPKSFSDRLNPLLMTFSAKEQVYEFRSHRLIPGMIYKAEFVPDIGGKVIEFREYRFSPEARRIYNLPGKFVDKATGKEPAWRPQGPKRVEEPRKNEPAKHSGGDEVFVFNLTPTVEYSRRYGNYLYFGTLDEYGNFKPSLTAKPVDVSGGEPKEAAKYIPLMSHIKEKVVYEFRSRTLVPGVIEKGEFLPDLDGKIIDFEEYRYSKTAKPIYNLPGKFVAVPKG